ncbi:MAG: hypothetical protein R2909_10495 [Gemmatimonadales bacterium]
MKDQPARLELPELGPWLGRLPEVARRDTEDDFALDPVRWAMVSELFERADAARDFLLAGDAEGARTALDRAAWLAVWSPVVGHVAGRIEAALAARVARAARVSAASPRQLEPLVLHDDDLAVLRAKLDAAAIPLERELARAPARGSEWLAQIRRACHALEASWNELEATARGELAARRPAIDRVARSEPRRLLWWTSIGVAAAGAGWLGLALGGYLPAPAWLAPFADWFWGLPWP